VAGGDEAIAAVVAGAGQDNDATGAGAAEPLTDSDGNGAAGVLHKLRLRRPGGEGRFF
jgi:hypothetical protein